MNVSELLSFGYNELKNVGIESYILDSQLLLQKILGKDKMFLLTNKDYQVNVEEINKYYDLIELRKNKMPVKYIMGYCEFMGLNFRVKDGVLIPRPDTEVLVEKVIEISKEKQYKTICDVCSGSGAIGIALSYFLGNIQVFCSDLSPIACKVTEENAKTLLPESKVKVFQSDLLQFALDMNLEFDVIVSNPPYIRSDLIGTLMEDVKKYEPIMALNGGEDGLEFYRKVVYQSVNVLKPGGLLAFEIGHDQAENVREIMMCNGYHDINVVNDLAGLNRVVTGIK